MRYSITAFAVVVLLTILVSCAHRFTGPRNYDHGDECPRHVSPPSQFDRYQILPGSLSPNGELAMLYPKRTELFQMDAQGKARLVLVRLSPFQELCDIPRRYSSFTGNVRCHYAVTWFRDSKAFLLIEGTRWGSDQVYLGEVEPSSSPCLTELTSRVSEQVRSSFLKSGAEPYNDVFEFVFDDEDRYRHSDTGGWEFTRSGDVRIDCTCTTDPKHMEAGSWTVNWSGTWNRKEAKFERQVMILK